MKTRAILALTTLLLIMSLVSAALADNGSITITAGTTVIVNNPNAADRLNLRTQPSQDAPTLGKYYNGTYLQALSDEKDGWVKVCIFDLEGYMMTDFLTDQEHLELGAATIPTVKIANAGGTGLNLRKEQSLSSTSLGLYPNGSAVRVFGVSETWCHVQTEDGNVGFMLREHLSPLLEYQLSVDDTDWSGPIGPHKTAEWPLVIDDYLAVVNNPNSADRLHLMTSASKKATSLGKYYNGVRVIINGPVDGEWTEVSIGNLQGYMETEYLIISGEGKPYPASAMPIMTINSPNSEQCVDLYAGQSKESEFLGVYYNGTQVILMGFNETWAHVIVDGKEGFMLAKYLE